MNTVSVTNRILVTGNSHEGFTISIAHVSLEEMKRILSSIESPITQQQIDEMEYYVENPLLKNKLFECITSLAGGTKLMAVKQMKEALGMGLKESKDIIDMIDEKVKQRGTGYHPENPVVDLLPFVGHLTEEARKSILSAFSKHDLHHFRGPINSANFGL